MIPPCKGCLLVPLCKHRLYQELFNCCSLLKQYIPHSIDRSTRNNIRVEMLQIVLKPSKWKYSGGGYVHPREPNYKGLNEICQDTVRNVKQTNEANTIIINQTKEA